MNFSLKLIKNKYINFAKFQDPLLSLDLIFLIKINNISY